MQEPTNFSWRQVVTVERWPKPKQHPTSRLEDHMFHWLNSILQHLYKAGDYLIQRKCAIPPTTREPQRQKRARARNVWKEKNHRKWERRDGPAGSWGQTPQEKKKKKPHNNKWPTSCSKVGKVSLTPSLRKNVILKKTSIVLGSPVSPIAQTSSLDSP